MDLLFVAIGLVLLTVGGEFTLRGAIGLAQKLGVSPAIIGLTVVGFGTSAPELVVTLQAALSGQPDLAVGNVIGSNISNILLILGVAGIIYPLSCNPQAIKRDAGMMILSMMLLVGLSFTGKIVAWQGALMVAALLTFIGYSYIIDRRECRVLANEAACSSAELHEKEVDDVDNVPENPAAIGFFTIAGIAGLVGGSHLLVQGATGIALSFGIPESIIGLTLVALGTSLPELAATVIAALRRHTDVAIANVMGSCVFNILSILGITALVTPLPIAPEFTHIDIWVMAGAALALIPILARNFVITRMEATLLLIGYVAYMGHLWDRTFSAM